MNMPARAGRDRAVITGSAVPGTGKGAVPPRPSRGSGQPVQLPVAPATVVAVLLADGWHQVASGSFTIGALSFGDADDRDGLGYRFEEITAASPYGPAAMAGPLEALLAVRQITPRGPRHWPQAVGRVGGQNVDAAVHRHRHTREPADLNQRKAHSA
jgi:hypothetical protein